MQAYATMALLHKDNKSENVKDPDQSGKHSDPRIDLKLYAKVALPSVAPKKLEVGMGGSPFFVGLLPWSDCRKPLNPCAKATDPSLPA